MKELSDSRTQWILVVILVLGGGLRFWGIFHGYPYSYYPDEAHFVKRALSFGSGDFNPHWFHKPAFFMYILFFEYGLMYLVGLVTNLWQGVETFAVFYVKNPGPFYIIGRITVCIFSTGIVFWTYLTGRQLFRRNAGLIAALIMALSCGHVMVSKDVKADIPCAFFTLISVYFLVKYFYRRQGKYLLLCSVFAGIGTATKTYSIVMLVPVFMALMLEIKKNTIHKIFQKSAFFLLCVLLFYFIYFLCAPYNFIDPMGRQSTFGSVYSLKEKMVCLFSADKVYEPKELEGQEKISTLIVNREISFSVYKKGIISYINRLDQGFGSAFLLLSFMGLAYLLIRRFDARLFCFLLFPFIFVFIAIFLHPGYSEIRHQVVIYPFLAIGAGFLVSKVFESTQYPPILGGLSILIIIFPILNIARYNQFISRQDTRNLAKQWIEANIAPDTRLLIDENTVILLNSEKGIHGVVGETQSMLKSAGIQVLKGSFTTHYDQYLNYQILAARQSVSYNIREIRFPWWRENDHEKGVHLLISEFDKDMGNHLKPVGVEDYEYYVQAGFAYAVVSGNIYRKFINGKTDNINTERFPWFAKFYQDLFKRGLIVKEFLSKGERTGPDIKILKFVP